MIPIRLQTNEEDAENVPGFCVVGVGGAGGNVLDRLAMDGVGSELLVAANTDVQALSGSVAAKKIQLGANLTRGLGTGGDPDLGYQAAEASGGEVAEVIEGTPVVFLCAGLGGGTGSGGLPIIARLAKEKGCFVVVLATMPFSFEGRRRRQQADIAMEEAKPFCDAVICFENDRMSDVSQPGASIHETFDAADRIMSQCLRALCDVWQRPSLIPCSLADLQAAVGRSRHCLFGFGESDSENRAHDALAFALKNPLLERGRLLEKSDKLLVHISGSQNLTLFEVETTLREVGRHVRDSTQILLSVGLDERLGRGIRVVLLSALEKEGASGAASALEVSSETRGPAMESREEPLPEETPREEPEEEPVAAEEGFEETEEPSAAPEPSPEEEPAAREEPSPEPAASEPVPEEPPQKEKPPEVRQEVLQFEPVSRGRFEKSEPTIEDGEDLDVPTFLRKNIKLK